MKRGELAKKALIVTLSISMAAAPIVNCMPVYAINNDPTQEFVEIMNDIDEACTDIDNGNADTALAEKAETNLNTEATELSTDINSMNEQIAAEYAEQQKASEEEINAVEGEQDAIKGADKNDRPATEAGVKEAKDAFDAALEAQTAAAEDLASATEQKEAADDDYAELKAQYDALLDDKSASQEDLNAAAQKLAAAEEALTAANAAVTAMQSELEAKKEMTLKTAYDAMMKAEAGSDALADAQLAYFKNYIAFVLGVNADDITVATFETSENDRTAKNAWQVTVKNENNEDVIRYFDFDAKSDDNNIEIFERTTGHKDEIPEVTGQEEKWEFKNGDETLVEEGKIIVESEDGNKKYAADTNVDVKNKVVDNFGDYQKTLKSNQSATITGDKTIETTVGTVDVVTSYEKKDVHQASDSFGGFGNFDATDDVKDCVDDYLAEHPDQIAKVKFMGKTYEYDKQSGWDKFWQNVGVGLFGWVGVKFDIEFVSREDDYTKPNGWAQETGIIEKTYAEVTTTTVDSGTKSDSEYGIHAKKNAEKAMNAKIAELQAAGYTITAYDYEKTDWVGLSYDWYVDYTKTTTAKENKVVGTKTYKATEYTNTKVQEKIDHVDYEAAKNYWDNVIDTFAGNTEAQDAIQGVNDKLDEIAAKQSAASTAAEKLAAAQQKLADAQARLNAVNKEGVAGAKVEAADEAYQTALDDYEAAKAAKEAIDASVVNAEKSYKNAVAQLARLYTLPDNGPSGNVDDDDDSTPATNGNRQTTNLVAGNGLVANVNANVNGNANVAAADGQVIEDNATPLADEIKDDKKNEEKTATLDDNATPLANAIDVDEAGFNLWWLLLLGVVVVAAGVGIYQYNKSKKADIQD